MRLYWSSQAPGRRAAEGPARRIRIISQGLVSLKDKEKTMISNALSVAGGNVARAARRLDVSRRLLAYKMKKHGLDRSCFKR
ncbi:MAG: hypothetical protein LBS31_04720 [Candidatus Adiutrix sp.]|jgi:DNA-binding NtrC family response regulator|nr:hypothetical protein [Candidatus Adiutrix sp.]